MHDASNLRKQNQLKRGRKITSFFPPLHAQTAILVNWSANGAKLCIDAFTIDVWWNFDKMQMIFKAITESSGHAFWWERTVLHSMETVVGRWSGSLGKYKSQKRYLLQYAKVPYVTYSKENFPRQRPAPWFLRQILLLAVQCRTILPTKGRDQNFRLSLWIWFASYQNSITPRSWKHLYSLVRQATPTRFTRFETFYVILLNIHKRLPKQRCSSHFIRTEEKKGSTIYIPRPQP